MPATRDDRSIAVTTPVAPGFRFPWLDLAAIAVLLFGIKLVLIHAFGTDLPYRDQWDAEARNLFIPYLEHGLWGVDWFSLHNVHRIVTTRVFALALLVANGRWDALVECVFSAAVHVAGALALACFVDRQVAARPARSVLIVVIVVGFASPFGWENILSGFQCQFYFLLLATVVMLMLASARGKTTGAHASIVLLGAIAFFSLAGGIFSCVAAAACVAFVGATSPRGRLSVAEIVCIAMLLGIAAAGYVYTPKTDSAEPVIAMATAWLKALYRSLSFPTTSGAALLWAPVVMLLYRTVREPRVASRLSVFALGLAFYVLLTDAGIASQRGDDLASRYKDLQWLGLFANLVSVHVLTQGGRTITNMRWKSAVFTTWAIVVTALLIDDGLRSLDQAGDRKTRLALGAVQVSAFVRTNDAATFEAQAEQLPHPSPALLELLLRNEGIRSILPPSIRPGFGSDEDRHAMPRWVASSGPLESGGLRRFCDLLFEHAETIFAFGAAAFVLLQVGARTTVRQ